MFKKLVCIILVSVMGLFALACGKSEEKPAFDPEAAFSRLLSEVKFDEKLEDASSYVEYSFDGVPEGADVKYHSADGQVNDCVIMFKLKNESDMKAARAALDNYISERKHQAEQYSPSEVAKLEKTVILESGLCLIACITNDTATAKSILNVK